MQRLFAIFIICLYTTTLFAAYDVKIAVYKNGKNLRNNITKIKSTKYKKYVKIDKKNYLYYAHAIVGSPKEAKRALSAYKIVFKDAFIDKKQVVLNTQKSKKNIIHKTSFPPIQEENLLNHKTVYLCYENSPEHLKKRVVKMDFENQKVTYTPLYKKNTTVDIACDFHDATVLLNVSDMNITHEISGIHDTYLSAKNSVKGVTQYTLRYYYTKEDALEFVKRN